MTKEQRAIENLTDLLKQRNEKQAQITTYDLFGNIETVLNMLKEKDKEIEHWKNGFERELENNRKNTCELLKQDLIIRQKDKQIDLMAEKIHFLGSEYDDFCIDTVWNEDCDKDCKNCIKQYFERKVKDGRD